jgi:A/G-specific adenine glycosylase
MDYPKEKGREILAWYLDNRRDLPWRKTDDPYKIWVSEIMLQQTRVEAVIDYYRRFLERFPDVASLAAAQEDDVLVLWKGLGYYSRAKNLHKAARIVAEKFCGRFPDSLEEVKGLPGIGDYTAGAILSIAYNQPQPAVDGNVLRVMARLEGLEDDILLGKTKQLVSGLVIKMIPEGHAGDFTQAMMELGALVCIPQTPRCDECPVQHLCNAYASGRQRELPIRNKKKAPPLELHYWAPVIIGQDGRILLEYRKTETLLGRLWGLPLVEKVEGVPLEELFINKYRQSLTVGSGLGSASHVFTHRVWRMEAVRCSLAGSGPLPDNMHWYDWGDMEGLAIPTAFQRVLDVAHPLKRG